MLQMRILVALIAIGCCGMAAADIRVFVTNSADGYGLDLIGPDGDGTGTDPAHEDWPIDPFRPTYSTVDVDESTSYGFDYHYAYYRVGEYPPVDAPSGTIDDPIEIDVGAGDWGYLWFQFREEFRGAFLNGLVVGVSEAGSTEPTADITPTYYLQNNVDSGDSKRWNGWASPNDGYANWHENPQLMQAVVAKGIRNSSDDPANMYANQVVDVDGWTGVALLGAVQGQASDTVYELGIWDWGYGEPPYPELGESCFFRLIPEPGYGVLWALAVVRLNRRGR